MNLLTGFLTGFSERFQKRCRSGPTTKWFSFRSPRFIGPVLPRLEYFEANEDPSSDTFPMTVFVQLSVPTNYLLLSIIGTDAITS